MNIDEAAALQNATHEATHALNVISDVQKAVSIAVAAVGLGTAIFNPTPGGIASSLDALVQAIQPKPAPAPDK